jgi:anti-anti-sigma factor
MNHPRLDSNTHFIGGMRELARGEEQGFIQELRPLVQSQSICLDMSRIERIDAAGLAALISISCDARLAGHRFTVVNPSRQVARIFALVGLDRVLVSTESTDSVDIQRPAPRFGLVAA